MTPSYSTEVTNSSLDWTYSKYYPDCQYNIFLVSSQKTYPNPIRTPSIPPFIDAPAHVKSSTSQTIGLPILTNHQHTNYHQPLTITTPMLTPTLMLKTMMMTTMMMTISSKPLYPKCSSNPTLDSELPTLTTCHTNKTNKPLDLQYVCPSFKGNRLHSCQNCQPV